MIFEPVTDLNNKIAVIAGGLGAIGYASARRLAALGATCVLLHRKGDHAEVRASELPSARGQQHLPMLADIIDSSSLENAAQRVQALYGRCDILINSAGYTLPILASDLKGLTDDLIDDLLRANFRGVFATIRSFSPMLVRSGDGLIVNVSSIAGFTGVGSNLAYVAAKAAVDVVGDALAKVLAPDVRVVSVSPGAVQSDFVPGRGEGFAKNMAGTTPLGRIGMPEDVAGTIEALATTMRFVTGTRIVVDGGRHL